MKTIDRDSATAAMRQRAMVAAMCLVIAGCACGRKTDATAVGPEPTATTPVTNPTASATATATSTAPNTDAPVVGSGGTSAGSSDAGENGEGAGGATTGGEGGSGGAPFDAGPTLPASCLKSDDCGPDGFCEWNYEQRCGHPPPNWPDYVAPGTCRLRPDPATCPTECEVRRTDVGEGVCGCDGVIYCNTCLANAEQAGTQKFDGDVVVHGDSRVGQEQLESVALIFGVAERLAQRTLRKRAPFRFRGPLEEGRNQWSALLVAKRKMLVRTDDAPLGGFVLDTEERAHLVDSLVCVIADFQPSLEQLASQMAPTASAGSALRIRDDVVTRVHCCGRTHGTPK
jgi:hypothetical protein